MKRKQKEKWLVIVSFKTELLTETIIHKGYRESLPKLLPNLPKFQNRMIIDNDIYVDSIEIEKIKEYFSTDIIKKATEVYDIIERQSKKLIKISKRIIEKIENISNVELSKKLDKFFKEYQNTIGAIGVPIIIDLTIESKLKEIIKESSIDNIEEALSTLAISSKPLETFKEKEDLLGLAEKISENKFSLDSKEVKLLIKEHYNEYGWLYSTLFLGELYDESQIKEEIKEILDNVKGEKKKLEEDKKEYLFNAEEIINKINSREGRKLAKFFQKSVYYRTARLEWMNKACFIVRPLLENVSNRLKINFNNLIYLLPKEIINSLKEGQLAKDMFESIEERQKGYAYVSDNKNKYILVTRLTTPDFVIAMKKSKGIVTDLGGVTSHASVTSRELKIPCIVGTKVATQVLKDGDEVEVDANEGVVRILKKDKN